MEPCPGRVGTHKTKASSCIALQADHPTYPVLFNRIHSTHSQSSPQPFLHQPRRSMQLSIVFVALAAVSSAVATPAQLSKRNHQITFTNNCAQTVTPMLTSTGGPFIRLAALGRGGSASATVGESVRAPLFSEKAQC
jgi:hypothetical protein